MHGRESVDLSTYRLLALDLDGTTLLDNKQISEANSFWIKKAIENNIIVSFATGRGVQNTQGFRVELGLQSPMVLLNGADIWKNPRESMERHFIDKQYIEQLHRISVETNSWFWGYSKNHLKKKPEWKHEDFSQEWMKFGISNPDISVINGLKDEINKWGHLEVTQSSFNNLEISIKGITKEYGVRKICEWLDISMDEVMAIGDSFNDMKLIKSVGLGIAMGNANASLKEIAKSITDTNENDGVAKAICEHLFETKYTGIK